MRGRHNIDRYFGPGMGFGGSGRPRGRRRGGSWTPSPGSIYPVLQQLEDEGLLTFQRVDGRQTATLTEDGTTYLEVNRAVLGTLWKESSRDGEGARSRNASKALKGLVIAWRKVMQAGTADQHAAATVILDDARKSMYRILADDES